MKDGPTLRFSFHRCVAFLAFFACAIQTPHACQRIAGGVGVCVLSRISLGRLQQGSKHAKMRVWLLRFCFVLSLRFSHTGRLTLPFGYAAHTDRPHSFTRQFFRIRPCVLRTCGCWPFPSILVLILWTCSQAVGFVVKKTSSLLFWGPWAWVSSPRLHRTTTWRRPLD